ALVLEGAGDAERCDDVRRPADQLVPSVVEADAAAARRKDAGDDVEDRRLARAVWPDQPDDLSVVHPEVEALDGLQPSEVLLQRGRLEERHKWRSLKRRSTGASPA